MNSDSLGFLNELVSNLSSNEMFSVDPPPEQQQQQQPSMSAYGYIDYLNEQQIPLQDTQIQILKRQQESLIKNFTQEGLQVLQQEEEKLVFDLEGQKSILKQIVDVTFLTPYYINLYINIETTLQAQLIQTNMLLEELKGNNCTSLLASLQIVKQPFPDIIVKSKKIDSVEIQLLTGSSVNIVNCSPIYAEIHKESKDKSTPEKFSQNIVKEDGKLIAKFNDIEFSSGSGLNIAYLRFFVQIEVNQFQRTFKEKLYVDSKPFIVITNCTQWSNSGRILLTHSAFISSNQDQISWLYFITHLQHQFILATRQSFLNPTRPLSGFDVCYLQRRFIQESPCITSNQFNELWKWYGECVHNLRNQNKLIDLWSKGQVKLFYT